MKNESVTRRHFLKRTAVAGLGLGLMGKISSLHAQDAPSNRIRVAAIGVNARGRTVANVFARVPGCEIATVCDVDSRALERTRQLCAESQGKEPAAEKDFRKVLEDPEIDAVMIATPNHWHAPMAILALKAGKHVYVEKPCSHNPREGELLLEATRKYDRVVQIGNQRRSWPRVKEAIDLVHNGAIGEVYHSRSWYANAREPIGHGKLIDVPEWLDYDLWQGPAPRRPYQDNIIHYNWHWFWDWGNGEAGNNGIHSIDLSRWGLKVGYPSRVTSSGGRFYHDDDWETPDTQMICYEFPDGKQITWEGFSCNRLAGLGNGFGVSFHGTDGSISIDGGNSYKIYAKNGKEIEHLTDNTPEGKTWSFERDAAHVNNFLDCIRNGGTPNSGIVEGHISTVVQQLGNIAQRVGRTLDCNTANGHILNDEEAMAFWSREYEPGWEPLV